MTAERWLPITGSGGRYAISTHGRVCSPNGVMTPRPGNSGYPTVSIRRDGVSRTHLVHVLVAEAFIGVRPPGHDVDHIDHDRMNPRLENLRYLPISENRASRSAGNTKLTEAQVLEILALPRRARNSPRDGNSLAAVAARYGVKKGAVADILSGRNWAHLQPTNPNTTPPRTPS